MSEQTNSNEKANVFTSLMHKKKFNKKEIKRIFDSYESNEEEQLKKMIKEIYIQLTSENKTENKKYINSKEGIILVENSFNELLKIQIENENSNIKWEQLEKKLDDTSLEISGKYWKLAPLIDFKIKLNLQQKNDNFYQLKVFIAGGIAGACSKTVGSPLSRITTLQQTHEFRSSGKGSALTNFGWAKKILKEEGLSGFFRGNLADVVRSIPYSGICYLVYEQIKKMLMPYDKSINGRNARLMAGGLSGPISLILVYPVDVIRTRLAAQTSNEIKYKGIIHTFNKIRKEEGMKAFYRGSVISLFQSFPNLAINFTIFEECVDKFQEKGYNSVFHSIVSGVISGTCAQTVTYPMDVIVRNMQLDGKGEKFKTPMDLIRKDTLQCYVNQYLFAQQVLEFMTK
eukprot:gene4492-7872_t